ncbi:hypothetical protein GCM10023235_74880 [Kitasatospora terrestris]|uniref:Uncharacterized protein n=1 Tax=Kitasatospora terrestris TaxID=258051 RepID=A0ABP9EN19_9ACTN
MRGMDGHPSIRAARGADPTGNSRREDGAPSPAVRIGGASHPRGGGRSGRSGAGRGCGRLGKGGAGGSGTVTAETAVMMSALLRLVPSAHAYPVRVPPRVAAPRIAGSRVAHRGEPS